VGALKRLPFGLLAKAEYEYVKAKPLGDGFTGVTLQETAFIAKLNDTGTALLYSTYLGGSHLKNSKQFTSPGTQESQWRLR